jgi:kynureninase
MSNDKLYEQACTADKEDLLAPFRDRFYQPDPDLIYLDGNSLGRLVLKTSDLLAEMAHNQWGEHLIESWNKHWYDMPMRLGNKVAPLIGASDGEVIMADNTSTNLYKLAHGALKLQAGKTRVVSDTLNFPTDLYILQGILKDAGSQYELVLAGTKDDIHPDLEELDKLIDNNTALVVLSLVTFKSGYLYDLKKVTRLAHDRGALILWDLSHAAGAVPLELNAAGADLAVGCTYKYLNGGPGSPAFLYVRNDLRPNLHSPVQGWFGEENPFRFDLQYTAAGSVRKYLTGTPPILSLGAVEPGIDLLAEAGMENLRKKSIRQSEYLLKLTHEMLVPLGFSPGSPENPDRRGSHVAIRHPHAYQICQALIQPESSKPKVIPDFRDPDIIRLGITPLYTTFTELFNAVSRIKEIVLMEEYLKFPEERKTVT